MAKGIIRKLSIVNKNIDRKMALQDGEGMSGFYARGMRSEGYLGGYRQAIVDVQLALAGGHPTTRELWDDPDL